MSSTNIISKARELVVSIDSHEMNDGESHVQLQRDAVHQLARSIVEYVNDSRGEGSKGDEDIRLASIVVRKLLHPILTVVGFETGNPPFTAYENIANTVWNEVDSIVKKQRSNIHPATVSHLSCWKP